MLYVKAQEYVFHAVWHGVAGEGGMQSVQGPGRLADTAAGCQGYEFCLEECPKTEEKEEGTG